MSVSAKTLETQLNNYFSKLIYATFNDIERDWNGTNVYNPLMHQNYANLCKDKKDRSDGLKSRFTISDNVRQYLAFMFGRYISELKNIQIIDGDNVATIRAKVSAANEDCYTEFMYNTAEVFRAEFGTTLSSAGDPTLWFHNQIVGFLPQYATKPVVVAIVSTEFDSFLKAMAWLFGQLLWYHEVSISGELFMGTLAQQGLSQIMRDMLQDCLRAKPPTKPRTKAVKKPGDVSVAETTEITTTGEALVTDDAAADGNVLAQDDISDILCDV